MKIEAASPTSYKLLPEAWSFSSGCPDRCHNWRLSDPREQSHVCLPDPPSTTVHKNLQTVDSVTSIQEWILMSRFKYCWTILRNSASSFHWLSSSIFNVRCLLFVRPASVTPPLISTIWCFRPYKPYIFCEDMILATCQCHSLLSWAQFTVV